MTRKKTYSGVTQLRIVSGEVGLNLIHSGWRQWRRAVVVDGNADAKITQKKNELTLEQFQGRLFLSWGHRWHVTAEGTRLTGQHPGGHLTATQSDIELSPPPSEPASWNDLLGGIWETGRDLLGIAILSLPMFAITTVVSQLTGAAPQDYAGIAILTAAGTYVGVAGRYFGSFLRATALAAALIFGPEIATGFREGADHFLTALGFEDICKTIWYATTWSIGSIGRNYFLQRTRT